MTQNHQWRRTAPLLHLEPLKGLPPLSEVPEGRSGSARGSSEAGPAQEGCQPPTPARRWRPRGRRKAEPGHQTGAGAEAGAAAAAAPSWAGGGRTRLRSPATRRPPRARRGRAAQAALPSPPLPGERPLPAGRAPAKRQVQAGQAGNTTGSFRLEGTSEMTEPSRSPSTARPNGRVSAQQHRGDNVPKPANFGKEI